MRDVLLWGLVCTFVLSGCGKSSPPTRLGDWTMKTNAVKLTKTLQVSESAAFYFGSVTDVAVTGAGRIVVADRKAKNIKVLAQDGSLIDTLGGPGEGPGEFQSLMNIQVARGDSLYAYDHRRSRLTVFAPGEPYSVARSLTVPRDDGYPLYLLVLNGQFVAAFSSSAASPEDGVHAAPPQVWRVVTESGTPADTVLHAPRGKMAIKSKGDGVWFQSIPFARTTRVRGGPGDRLYHGWTDSLHIKARTVSGAMETIANIPTSPVPVSEVERDSALREINDDMQAMVGSAIPDTKPAFTDFWVAQDGRVWVQRPEEESSVDEVSWWILDPDAKTINTVHLPREMHVAVIRNGQVYGSTTTKLGAPAVVRYRISEAM